jgi:hypothetical protein
LKATSSNAVLTVHVPQLLAVPRIQPDGLILLVFSDADGGRLTAENLLHLEVQVSSNLVDWMALPGALTLHNGSLELQAATVAKGARFYRIVESWSGSQPRSTARTPSKVLPVRVGRRSLTGTDSQWRACRPPG